MHYSLFTHKTVIKALNRHLLQTRVIASGYCPPSLQTIVSIEFLRHCRVGLCGCVFLFSEGEEIFFNSILSAWERWKLFCKLWSVLGLVRLANVLTPVRWLELLLFP